MVTKKRFHASTCPQRFAQTGAPSKQIRFRVAMQAGAPALVVMVSSPEPRQAIRPNQGLIPSRSCQRLFVYWQGKRVSIALPSGSLRKLLTGFGIGITNMGIKWGKHCESIRKNPGEKNKLPGQLVSGYVEGKLFGGTHLFRAN